MESKWVDFKEVKAAVSLEMVLARYNIALRRVNRESLRGACPLPSHSSKGEQSFGVHTSKNVWACQSASCVKSRQGRRGGNVLDFVAVMEGCTIRDAALKLANWFNVSDGGRASPPDKKMKPAASEQLVAERKEGEGEVTNHTLASAENKPLGFVLKTDHSHPYLTARSITPETAAHFGVGYFSGKGSMAGRIVIPIQDRQGRVVAYAGRSIDNTEPKYKLPAGFHKSVELFNVWRAVNPMLETLVIVEGFFDCMKVHQAGHSSVIALMGWSLSEHQEKVLLDIPFRRIVLMLDGDEAGKRAADEIALRLARRVFVRIASVPDGRQPDELSDDELKNVLGSL